MKKAKKFLSLLLSLTMVIGMLPGNIVFADTTHTAKITTGTVESIFITDGSTSFGPPIAYNDSSGSLGLNYNVFKDSSTNMLSGISFSLDELPTSMPFS